MMESLPQLEPALARTRTIVDEGDKADLAEPGELSIETLLADFRATLGQRHAGHGDEDSDTDKPIHNPAHIFPAPVS